jgi:hypothetical protein
MHLQKLVQCQMLGFSDGGGGMLGGLMGGGGGGKLLELKLLHIIPYNQKSTPLQNAIKEQLRSISDF